MEAISDQGTPPKRGITHDALWLTAGNAAAAAVQVGYLILASKVAGVDGAGRFAYASTLATQAMLLAGLQLRILQASDVRDEFPFSCYFTLRMATTLLAGCATLVAASVHGISTATGLLLMGLGATRAIESISEIILAHGQRHGRFQPTGRSLVLRAALSLAGFSTVLWASRNLPAAAASVAVCTLCVLVFHDLRLVRGQPLFQRSTPMVIRLARRSSSLGLTTLFGSTYSALPRYLVKAILGDSALGYYATVAQLPLTGAVLVRSMSEAATPTLARHFQQDGSRRMPGIFWRLILATAGLYGAGLLVALAFGRPILILLYTPAHAALVSLLALLMLAEMAVQFNTVLMFSATASRRLVRQPLAMFLSLAVLASSTYWATVSFSLHGTALAGIASGIFLLGAYAFVMRRQPDPLARPATGTVLPISAPVNTC